METLKVKDILKVFKHIQQKYNLTKKELDELNVYLGDDEELNGLHFGLFCQELDIDKAKGYRYNDIMTGKIKVEEYSEQSMEQMVKDYNDKQVGLCILIS